MHIIPINNSIKINKIVSTGANKTVQTIINPDFETDNMTINNYAPRISFGAKIHKYAINGDWEGIQKELKKGVSINLKDKNGRTPLFLACVNKRNSLIDNLLKIPNIDVNAQDKYGNSALIEISSLDYDYDGILEKLLGHRDIDVDLKNVFGHDAWHATENYHIINTIYLHKEKVKQEMFRKMHSDVEREVRAEVTEQIREEERKQAKKELTEEKCAIDNRYRAYKAEYERDKSTLEKINEEITRREQSLDHTIKSKLEEIRNEERETAEKNLRYREHVVAYREAQVKEKNRALDNLIKNYQSLLAADIQHERNTLASAIRTQYGIKLETLPEDMSFTEQLSYVMDILIKQQSKLTGTNNDTPERITKALQDDNQSISNEGLKFIERVIEISRMKISEKELTDAINSVKGKYGLIDMNKSAFFIKTLLWGNNTINSTIEKVNKLTDKQC